MTELSSRKKIVISSTDLIEKEEDNNNYYFNGKKLEIKENEIRKTEEELAWDKITEIINKFLGRQYENTIVLTGAGSSILKKDDINEEIDEEFDIKIHSGKTVAEMEKEIKKHLKEIPNVFHLDELATKVKYIPEKWFNVEDLLTRVDMAKDYIDGGEKKKFEDTVREIEKKIKNLCDIKLCKYHKHGEFINKLVAKRKSHNRVKIFITNYDTLFEQALQQEGYIVVDGFSYEFPRKFNSSYFDYDFIIRGENKIIDEPEYVDKVVHLLKIHGSIDWTRNDDGEIIKEYNRDNESLMIVTIQPHHRVS